LSNWRTRILVIEDLSGVRDEIADVVAKAQSGVLRGRS
jgi:hypothetical protein